MAERGAWVEIDLTELEKLCHLQCTDVEIAAWFNVSARTIERRRLEPEFAEVMERGKAKGRISVRRMQMKLLEQGNATMGVWLGKNLLAQTDRIIAETRVIRCFADLSVEELKALQTDASKKHEDAEARIDAPDAIVVTAARVETIEVPSATDLQLASQGDPS